MADRRFLRAAGAAFALLAAGRVASQPRDDFPSRPVRLVTSYGAGNIADSLARIVAAGLSEQLRQSVVVENRPGQGGSLGAQVAAKSPPDGYTLLFSAMAAFGINPHVYARVGYDPIADFSPVVAVAQTGSGILYTSPQLPVRTFAELVALSRSKPGTLNYGTAGSGTVPHLNMESLKARSGLDATHVPFKAAMAVMTDVVGGQVHMAQESAGIVLPHVRSGRVRALAVTGPDRVAELPDVPALTELVPGYDPVRPWMGVLAPAGTPLARIAQLRAAADAALKQPETLDRIRGLDLHVLNAGPPEFAAMIRRDFDRLGPLVRSLKLQAD